MECNRSEAMRAMEMAEQKFASQDYTGARKLALKAQQLFPALENIGQMLAVIDVHVAAQARIGINEKDWYGILQIEPTADDAVVKKQYRKLALFLHPDKNKSIGAESAFKLIGEALQVLSDKVKRLVYDAKRGMHARVNHTFTGSSESVNNCWQNQVFQQQQHPYSDTFNKTSQRHFPQPPQMPPEFHLFTFWTACTSCQMRYQYYRKYENQNLLCPQCRRPFIAKDLSNMQRANFTQTWTPRAGESVLSGSQARQSNSHTLTGCKTSSHTFTSFNSSSCNYFNGFASGGRSDTFQMFSGATSHINGKGNASSDKNESQFVRGMHYSGDAEKELLRKIKELRKSAAKERAKQKNQSNKSSVNLKGHSVSKEGQGYSDYFSARKDISSSGSELDDEFWERVSVKDPTKANAGHLKRKFSYNLNGSVDNLQEGLSGKKAKFDTEIGISKEDLEAIDMAKKLADFAKNAIRVKLNLPRTNAVATGSAAGQASGKRKNIPGLKEKHEDLLHSKTKNLDKKDEVLASCSVPDADFHNFDEGREEKDVEVGQVWALYDDKDGMPKYYMKVKEVRSRTPFKVVIGWFELRKPSDELCELLDLGFSIACGEFRMSSSQIMDSVNSFSHLVNWDKSGKGLAKIYPKRGQIWCIYKYWKEGQQVLRVGDGLVGYSMVEVLSDCCEVSGASVMLLCKVEGFKAIFQISTEGVFQVPFLEVLRFSHRVPARKLEGTEAPGISRDCWELDPAAIPSCLVHSDQQGGTEVSR
ncbi:hypothetical protein GOP47_0028770 [Adiantum capillus-veneris]|nr:hypothetical protein GOP47_0028770 [Adiantum capillus-veneris]